MKDNMKKRLAAMYQSVPPVPDAEGMDHLIQAAKDLSPTLPRASSLLWFMKTQLRFIDPKVWVLQMLILCAYAIYISFAVGGVQGFLILVPIVPMVVFIGTGELSRSFRYRMAEMEIPTRFSLRKVLLARLILIGVGDLFTWTCLIVMTALHAYSSLGAMILYGLVPGLLTAYGSLYIMNRCKAPYCQYYIAAYSFSLSAVGAISINLWPAWYNASAFGIWVLVFCMALVGVCTEVYKMLKNCSQRLETFD